eukprot:1282183-Karenia_brevis.AAC.1
MACAGCGEPIKPRTIRMMCLKSSCQFHVCNKCKGEAEMGAKGGIEEGQTGMDEAVEGNKRGGHTPGSQRKAKKGREGGSSASHVELSPQM